MPRPFQPLSRESLLTIGVWMGLAAACHGQSAYNFGNPSADEQLYIECINRARANPAAEGARLAASTALDVTRAYSQYAVDLALMQTEFNAIAAAPPLAPSAGLTTSARAHAAWMLANAAQSHNETNPANTPWDRITAAGYSYMSAGENIFAYATSVWHGHAGFNVDWGSGGTGGMQDGRGHRTNIHSANFHEIGVGVVLGSNSGVGPQLVTQDFGTQSANPTFGTGVAYYDLNGNNAYDAGEGIAGLSVNVSGASYACTTASGGGWVVPVPNATATRTVTFSGLNLNQSVTLGFVKPATGIAPNAKADLKLSYTPPVVSSLASTTAG
ncbi:MAG: CAP domain-containing protein, partial [Verrucomicrobiota bacterium]